MIPYIFLFSFCFTLSVFDLSVRNKISKKFLLFIFGFCIIIFAGIRWETGTDWEDYLGAFNKVDTVNFGESGYELFYELFLRFSSFLSGEYTLVLILTASIIFSLTCFPIYKYSPFPLLSCLLLLSYSINSIGFGYRQDLAIAFTFFSTYFIINRNLFYFILFISIATLFHQSAIIFLPAYWIGNLNWNKKTFFLIIIITFVLYILSTKLSLIATLYSDSAAAKVSNYTDLSPEERSMNSGDPLIVLLRGLVNRIFIILPLLFVLVSLRDNKLVKIFFNLFAFGLVLYIILSPLGYVFLRFTRYYHIFHILLIPFIIYFSKSYTRIALSVFYLIYCFIKFSFVLITDEGIYVPYQTIF